jgi:Ca-activated chloride channel family protein
VRLLYLQPISIDGGIGRYVYPLEEGNIDEEVHAFWDRLPLVHDKFTFECTLRSSYPLDDVRANGAAQPVVTQDAPDTWRVWIEPEAGTKSLDSDIVVYYRLAPDQPARVDLLSHRAGDGPGTFMLVVTPGVDLKPTAEGTDWMIVLDISGSMATKLSTAADAVSRALEQFRPGDRFRVVVFNRVARELTRGWQPVSETGVEMVRQDLLALESNGGTNIYAGLRAGLNKLDGDRTSAVILVSDGGANDGPTAHKAFLDLLARKDVRLFTFVMGQGANRPLLERMAEASNGFSMGISNQDDLYGRLMQARAKLGREALHGVRVELEGADVADRAPQRLPSVYFGQQIVLFGRYLQPGKATLRLRAKISGEERSWETRIDLPERDETYPEIERLWAFASVRDLQRQIDEDGERSELRPAIVALGTEYSIVTDHTTMIVVREERFEELGIDRRNKRRVADERAAREARAKQVVVQTRADGQQPMFGDSRAHDHGGGGGFGVGASGPAFLMLLAGLYGVREWLRRRSRNL